MAKIEQEEKEEHERKKREAEKKKHDSLLTLGGSVDDCILH